MSRALTIKLSLAVLLSGLLALFAVRHDVGPFIQQAAALLRAAGPAKFFLAMALLPAIGAPLTFFSLTAGLIFGPQLGMPAVITLSLAAIGINIALSHVLASRALRPAVEYALKRLGYPLPRVTAADVTNLIVLLRVTPGLPFPAQNYLLGLAKVPFLRYLLVSCLIVFPLNAAIIILGEALLHGRGKMALSGLLLLLTLMVATHLARKHYRTKEKAGG